MAYPHVPFPLTFTSSSPYFQLAPIASSGTSGWAPSCTTSACASNATWFTGVTGSTFSFSFWGWDASLEGSVQGNMNVKMTLDGQETAWNPSNGTLFELRNLDNLNYHTISLTVLNASSNSLLSVNKVHVNGSTLTDQFFLSDQWWIDSNDSGFSYNGFAQQASAAGSASPTTYVSSKAGDTASIQVNASAIIIYGPCGPSNGLMRVSIDNELTTVNTSKPIQADDCLLFQSKGLQSLNMHSLVITNVDDRSLAINRMEFLRTVQYVSKTGSNSKVGMIIGIVVGVIALIAVLVVTYSMRSRKTRQKINRTFTIFCS